MAWFKEEAFLTLQPLQNSLSVLEGKEDQPVSLVVTLAEVVDAITRSKISVMGLSALLQFYL